MTRSTLRHAARSAARWVTDYWPGRRTVLMTLGMTALFLFAGASAAHAADGTESGGILGPLNVMSSEGVPLDHYDLQSQPGGVTDLRSHVCDLLLGAGFSLVRLLVGLICWLASWVFTFPIVRDLTQTATHLHYSFLHLMTNQLGLWELFLAGAFAFGLVLVMRGKVGRGVGEIVLTLLLASIVSLPIVAPSSVLGPDGPLAQSQQAAHEVGQMTANVNGTNPGCTSDTDRTDPSCPMRIILTRTLVVQPYELLQYGLIPDPNSSNQNIRGLADVHRRWIHGEIKAGNCAAAQVPIYGADAQCSGGAFGVLLDELKKHGQEGKDAANFAVDSNWDRVGGVALVLLAAFIVATIVLSMALVHLGCQIADVVAAALDAAALIWAMLPGANRTALWKWLGVFMASIVTEFAVSIALPLFALGADGILSSSESTVMIQRLVILDAFALVLLAFHRRIFAAAGRVGDRFATRMRYARIGGSLMGGDESRLGLAMSQAMGGLAPGGGFGGFGGFGGGLGLFPFGPGGGGGGFGGGMHAAMLRRSRIGQGLAALGDPGLGKMNAGLMAAGAAGELHRGIAALALPGRAAHHLIVGSPLPPHKLARRMKPVATPGNGDGDGTSNDVTPFGHTLHNALLNTRAGRIAIRAGQAGKLGFNLTAGAPASWTRLNRDNDRMWQGVNQQWAHYSNVAKDWWADEKAGVKSWSNSATTAYNTTKWGYGVMRSEFDGYGGHVADRWRSAATTAHAATLMHGRLADTDAAFPARPAYSATAEVWEHAKNRGPEYPFYEVSPAEAPLRPGPTVHQGPGPGISVHRGGDAGPADLGAALGPGVVPARPVQVVPDSPGMVVDPATGEILSPGSADAVMPDDVMRRVSPQVLNSPANTALEALRMRRHMGESGVDPSQGRLGGGSGDGFDGGMA